LFLFRDRLHTLRISLPSEIAGSDAVKAAVKRLMGALKRLFKAKKSFRLIEVTNISGTYQSTITLNLFEVLSTIHIESLFIDVLLDSYAPFRAFAAKSNTTMMSTNNPEYISAIHHFPNLVDLETQRINTRLDLAEVLMCPSLVSLSLPIKLVPALFKRKNRLERLNINMKFFKGENIFLSGALVKNITLWGAQHYHYQFMDDLLMYWKSSLITFRTSYKSAFNHVSLINVFHNQQALRVVCLQATCRQ
jgi:hypothetical protein